MDVTKELAICHGHAVGSVVAMDLSGSMVDASCLDGPARCAAWPVIPKHDSFQAIQIKTYNGIIYRVINDIMISGIVFLR